LIKIEFGIYFLLLQTDLSGANLRGANLQGVNLQGAKLEEAKLEEAKLQRANLRNNKYIISSISVTIYNAG